MNEPDLNHISTQDFRKEIEERGFVFAAQFGRKNDSQVFVYAHPAGFLYVWDTDKGRFYEGRAFFQLRMPDGTQHLFRRESLDQYNICDTCWCVPKEQEYGYCMGYISTRQFDYGHPILQTLDTAMEFLQRNGDRQLMIPRLFLKDHAYQNCLVLDGDYAEIRANLGDPLRMDTKVLFSPAFKQALHSLIEERKRALPAKVQRDFDLNAEVAPAPAVEAPDAAL